MSEYTREPLLEVSDLVVEYDTDESVVHAVNHVSFRLGKGETLGLAGETGAGKTTIAKSILRILPDPPSKVRGGKVVFEGTDLLALPENKMRKIRGNKIAMIFQDPMTALNPIETVGSQIAEAIQLHEKLSRAEVEKRAVDMLEMVGIPGERYGEYPHQFSGGMKQRVVIAMALACHPELLLADEPTTALDVSIQAQVLNLMLDLQEERGLTYMFITHDLSAVKYFSNDIMVMYLGQVVEKAPADELFARPLHPYTKALLSAIPIPDVHKQQKRILLKGEISSPINPKPGCRFAARCPYATDACREEQTLTEIAPGHFVACHRACGSQNV